MSAYSKNYFKDGYVEKGDSLWLVSRTRAAYQGGRPDSISYPITPYTVTAVGKQYLSAKPKDGGKPVKFMVPPAVMDSFGLYLVQRGHTDWWERLVPSRELAETYRRLLEQRDAEHAANGGGG